MTYCNLYDIDYNLKIVNRKLVIPIGLEYPIVILMSRMSYGALEKHLAPDAILVSHELNLRLVAADHSLKIDH